MKIIDITESPQRVNGVGTFDELAIDFQYEIS